MTNNNDGLRPADLIGQTPEEEASPSQILEALLRKALSTNSIAPITQGMAQLQNQADGLFQILELNLQRFGHVLSLQDYQLATLRMTIVAFKDLLISKGVLTSEEWDTMYAENVQKKMEERIAQQREQYEKAMKEREVAGHIADPEPAIEEPPVEEPPGKETAPSNVVLASERCGSVITFPSKKEEE